jgi:hypothetical protein
MWSEVVAFAIGRILFHNLRHRTGCGYPKESGFTGGEEAPTAVLNCVLGSGHTPGKKIDMLQQPLKLIAVNEKEKR